ncbi:Yip1 family protein [Massilia horti]|uniref:YIP1 family protein n=1 Tax=Massilia horti TaxID=2562153 RepID=A0A4Y9T5R1_9BURK|nr:Yip1 family protein [Massilia horti]TFW36196.1 YIP1 family protein [Massilia horti]
MNLIERAKNISLNPRTEWEVIAPEATTTSELYTRYIVPLAAIGPLASFAGMTAFGISIPIFGTYRMPVMMNLSMQLTSYVVALVSVFVLALVIDALSPSFGGQKGQIQALKLAAYAYTPAWIAGVLLLLPSLSSLVLLVSLYGFYVFYLGVSPMMQVPKDRAIGFTAATIACAIVLAIVGSAVTGVFLGAGEGLLGGRL